MNNCKNEIDKIIDNLPKYESEECFEIISGQMPVYSFETRVTIANRLFTLATKEKISFKKAWNTLLRKEYIS